MATRHRLLDTPPEKVPHEFAQEVIDFAKPVEAVTAAYVAVTEVSEDFKEPYEQLAAAFELGAEDDGALEAFANRFYESMPADVQAGGCNVLDAGGAAAWRKQAQLVFSR
jgi:hypothetical protein